MRIVKCSLNVPFRHFWLKTVEDVNLNEHCINCLIGRRDYRIKAAQRLYENVSLNSAVYYLCGVVYPFDWKSNFHLAFEPSKGSVIHEEQNGVSIIIQDAVKLPISTEFIDPKNPHFNDRFFYTCRNWQFAHWFYKNRIMNTRLF